MDDLDKQLDREVKLLKIETERLNREAAKYRLTTAQMALRPSLFLPVEVKRDGPNWLCIFYSTEEMHECCMAYGPNPNEAMINFDNIWMGLGEIIEPPEDYDYEDEEEF